MMDMLNRRALLTATFLSAALLTFTSLPRMGLAQAADAAAFVDQAGKDLVAVIDGPGSASDKQAKLRQIVDRIVDVDSVARFCLGRFWRTATPEQQKQYLELFHQMLEKSISSKLGEFQGVTFALGRAVAKEGGVAVSTVVTRPNTAPANVDWVVSTESGSPRIVDVVAEGTSLRLTQRSDYASFLSQHDNSVPALIQAIQQQLAQSS
jgi:phospholipid transport system substrate-binding protein